VRSTVRWGADLRAIARLLSATFLPISVYYLRVFRGLGLDKRSCHLRDDRNHQREFDDELWLTLRDCETCKLRAKHCLHLSKHRNMNAPRHAAEPCAWASNGWKGGRYCGCGVLLCRNAFENPFRLLRIHRHRKGSDGFGVSKATLTAPALLWSTAIAKKFTNFDARGSYCDNLHGNSS
jgi:hypothetical protein